MDKLTIDKLGVIGKGVCLLALDEERTEYVYVNFRVFMHCDNGLTLDIWAPYAPNDIDTFKVCKSDDWYKAVQEIADNGRLEQLLWKA